MKKEFLINITTPEMMEYSSLYDRLYALESLKKILQSKTVKRNEDDNILQNRLEIDTLKTIKEINIWWGKIDKKYMLAGVYEL